ncbi:MAG: hypothetical protein ABIH37_01255 [archaeon]
MIQEQNYKGTAIERTHPSEEDIRNHTLARGYASKALEVGLTAGAAGLTLLTTLGACVYNGDPVAFASACPEALVLFGTGTAALGALAGAVSYNENEAPEVLREFGVSTKEGRASFGRYCLGNLKEFWEEI